MPGNRCARVEFLIPQAAGITVPWKSLKGRSGPSPEPTKRSHKYRKGEDVVLCAPSRSGVIKCDCPLKALGQPDRHCKWHLEGQECSIQVAKGKAWCDGGGYCRCEEGFQEVLVVEFLECSWTTAVGVPVANISTDWIPESKDKIPSGGITVPWVETSVLKTTQLVKKPDGRCGPWSEDKKQKAAMTRMENRKSNPVPSNGAGKKRKTAPKKGGSKRQAAVVSAPVRQSSRPTAGKSSMHQDYDTGVITPDDSSADD